MKVPTIIGSASAVSLYHQLKNAPLEKHEKMLRESRAATVRLSEERVQAEKQRITEREHRLRPVYGELAAAIRKSPELKGVVQAIDSTERRGKPKRPLTLAPSGVPAQSSFATRIPIVRLGSIHIVESGPFITDTWAWQEGDSNVFISVPVADSSGNMFFEMQPGVSSSGQMSCWAAVSTLLGIPNAPCIIEFSASPSYYWYYFETSTWWRESAGNMWIGQHVDVFNRDGTFLGTAVDSQYSLASFDDRNLDGFDQRNSGPNTMQLTSGISVALGSLLGLGDVGSDALGGFLKYQCWIGGSCNADGSNSQSACGMYLHATCPNLIMDIDEF